MKKKSRLSLTEWIIFTVCLVLTVFSLSAVYYTLSSDDGKNELSEIVEKYVVPAEESYHYKLLDEEGKYIYDEMLRQLICGRGNCKIKNVSSDAISKDKIVLINYALVNDHPELFWLGKGVAYSYNKFSKALTISLYQYDFWKNSHNKKALVEKFFSKVDEIVDKAEVIYNDFDRIVFVHDYLVDTIDYAYEAVEDYDDGKWSIETSYAFTGYGAIVNELCVCGGYAEAFQLILQQLGYECTYISGESTGSLHAWNVVKISGDYYLFDVTWDDVGDWLDEYGELIYTDGNRHNYFAAITEEFSKEHTDLHFTYPLCAATDYNYYYHGDYVVESLSISEIRRVLKKQFDEGLSEINIKFTDNELMAEAELYVLIFLREYMREYGYSDYHRLYDSDMCVITYIIKS